MADGNNVLDYPQMTRQREENIQANEIAYAEDVNAELNYIMSTYNQLVAMLTGEWGDGTGRIYELVDNAVSLANQAIAAVQNCVLKTGDTMTGHLNIALVPASDYNVVNKKYVDDTIDAELADPINRISQLETWKENLDATQVKLSNANFSGTNVNDGMNELFISVSNGKAIVAAAITGKGIETASDASFKTMADNINAILTFTEGTSGGTATAQDIMYGKTAYARNSLIVGSYIPLDTSDATASAGTIAEGYTAYAKGQKVTGTMQAYPVFGTDTSGATAMASDIAYGKTAYARGQLLVGTMQSNVEEIYGLSTEPFDIKTLNDNDGNPPDGASKLDDTNNYRFSQDGNYCVRWDSTEDNQYVLESFAVNDDGLYYQASSGATTDEVNYKKYRYTFEELGIIDMSGGAAQIKDIAFGAPGFEDDMNKCILAILYRYGTSGGQDKYHVKFLTYHLKDNGVIGQAYDGEGYIIDATYEHTVSSKRIPEFLAADPNNPLIFYMNTAWYSGSRREKTLYRFNIIITPDAYSITRTSSSSIERTISDYMGWGMYVTEDGKYCYILTNDYAFVWYVNSGNNLIGLNYRTCRGGMAKINNVRYAIDTYCDDSRVGSTYNIVVRLRPLVENSDGTLTDAATGAKAFIVHNGSANNNNRDTMVRPTVVTADGKKIVNSIYSNTVYTRYITVHNVEDVLALDDYTIESEEPEYVAPVQSYTVGNYSAGYPLHSNKNTTRIILIINKSLIGLISAKDIENVIAVIYKNQYFSKVQPQTLSAGGPDVRAGKTFIGWMGYPETGTLEV